MATATVDMDPDLDDVVYTPEEIEYARRLHQRAAAHRHTPYRKALLARIEAAKRGAKLPELPGGVYESYRVVFGQHSRHDLKDKLENAERYNRLLREYRENAKAGVHGQPPQLQDPRTHTFNPGDVVTPETDAEALMMDQDAALNQPKKKFAAIGREDAGFNIDELTAETNRLKLENQRLAAVEEENAKLRAALEAANKGNRGGGKG